MQTCELINLSVSGLQATSLFATLSNLIIIAFFQNATVQYSSESVFQYVCVRVCVRVRVCVCVCVRACVFATLYILYSTQLYSTHQSVYV